MKLINATDDGHRSLYHYQSFKGDYVQYLESTLLNRAIHLSKPSSFNDPWDCKPWFNSGILDDPSERQRHLEWIVQTSNLGVAVAAELTADPPLLRAIIEGVRDGHIKSVDDQYRLYCLTPNPLNQLMWSHYGDNHRGICLEFDANALQMIGAYKIYYSRTYPTVRFYENEENAVLIPIFTKSDVWEYEREYRLIAEEAGSPRRSMLTTVQSDLSLERGTLVGIVAGCQCAEEQVIDLVERHAPELRVRRAKRVPDRYELQLEDVRAGRI